MKPNTFWLPSIIIIVVLTLVVAHAAFLISCESAVGAQCNPWIVIFFTLSTGPFGVLTYMLLQGGFHVIIWATFNPLILGSCILGVRALVKVIKNENRQSAILGYSLWLFSGALGLLQVIAAGA